MWLDTGVQYLTDLGLCTALGFFLGGLWTKLRVRAMFNDPGLHPRLRWLKRIPPWVP